MNKNLNHLLNEIKTQETLRLINEIQLPEYLMFQVRVAEFVAPKLNTNVNDLFMKTDFPTYFAKVVRRSSYAIPSDINKVVNKILNIMKEK